MKINIKKGENPQVSECWIDIKEESLSIFINTKDKWIQPEYTVTGRSFEDITKNQIEFVFECGDEVSLISETEEEFNWLSSIRFECHCKDQLWFYFPKEFIRL